ncbi:MAG: DNA primase [Chlorobi bacterium]|nr:DNA primase [Chlorobiota bacterium]
MIDQGTVERIIELANNDIVDIVSEFVQLKRRGVNYLGRCPFHDEKTPSFTVSPSKGIFKCFGCGKGGNAVSFLMEHEHTSFVETIKYLGEKYHVHIEEEEMSPEMLQKKSERESLMVITEFAAKFFTDTLHNTDEGKSVGLGYLRQRGIRDDIITKFQLGYSPEKYNAFTTEALKKGYKLEYLQKAGLTTSGKSDTFRGRVIFPIHSLSGKVIAFGGRILKTTEGMKVGKYLNSPESELYHKSSELYGIYLAKNEIQKQDKCYLVEGYTDVIAMHQAGITNVVASSGTSLTTDQIKKISRFTKNITILYDGDNAGIKAALRGIDMILSEGMNVRVLLFPEGEDPDSFAKKMQADELKQYLNQHETSFVKFKASLGKEAENDPIKKASLIQDIVRSISLIPDSIIRSVFIQECSNVLDIKEDDIHSYVDNLLKKRLETEEARRRRERMARKNRPETNKPAQSSKNNIDYEEREMLKYLIKYGNEVLLVEEDDSGDDINVTVGEYIIRELKKDNITFSNPVHNRILELYEKAMKDENFSPQKFFRDNADIEIGTLASELMANEYELSAIHEKFGSVTPEIEILHRLVPKIVTELKFNKVKLILKELNEKVKAADENDDYETAYSLLQEIKKWENAKKIISKELGDRTIV